MPRLKGQKSPTYEVRRAELLGRLRKRLGRQGAMRASWRELAAAAEVGLQTLVHYFGKREDIVLAVMRDDLEQGTEPIAVLATPSGDFRQSVHDAVTHLANGFRYGGVGEIHALGLAEGLRHPILGPGFVDLILQPGIEAVSARLSQHQSAGEMITCNPRHAAIALIAPVLLAFLHQEELYGKVDRPLDLSALLDHHAARFVQGYQQII